MQPEDLLHLDDFVRWVIAPDAQLDEYWNAWMQQDPLNKTNAEEARKIVLSVYQHERKAAQGHGTELSRQAWQEISRQLPEEETEIPVRKKIPAWVKYAAAASILTIALVTFFRVSQPERKAIVPQAPDLIVHDISPSEIQFNNNGSEAKLINLADGSRVTLSKNSSLHYARLFNGGKREVYLEGEAFFEVAKDKQRPFYVYSGNIVTRVLGTSFRISSDDSSGNVIVAVKTGKVTVSRQNETTASREEEYVLVPNKQLVFAKKAAKPVIETLKNEDWHTGDPQALPGFSYDGTSLHTILDALAKTYAVDIIYDKEKSEKCFVTVSLDGGSLYDKLDLLCKVTGAAYHTEGYKIYINNKGCN